MGESMLTNANQNAKLEALQHLMSNLLGPDGNIVLDELIQFNLRAPCWLGATKPLNEVKSRTPVPSKTLQPALLQLIDPRIIIPATKSSFVVEKNFVVNVHNHRDRLPTEGILIRELGPGIKQFLMDEVEVAQEEQILWCHDLIRDTQLNGIALALGQKSLYTTLTSLHYLLIKQAQGQSGYLKNSGTPNAFLVRGIEKREPTRGFQEKFPLDVIVKVTWGDRGWVLNAAKATHGTPQTERVRFFSQSIPRESVVEEKSSNDEGTVQQMAAA